MTFIIGENKQTNIQVSKDQALYDPKIRKLGSLTSAIDTLKETQPTLRIGWTNGKFRMLTPAHVLYLNECKSKCHLLIVGINSDFSLEKANIKSPLTDKERAFMISQLPSVNFVVLFDDETPYQCISFLRPDVVMKGPDYKKEDVISAGRPVEIIDSPILKPFSEMHCSKILQDPQVSEMRYKYFKV